MPYPGQKYRQEQSANQNNQSNNNNHPQNPNQYGQQGHQNYAPNQNFGGPVNGMPGGNMSSPYNQPNQQFPNQPPPYNNPPMNGGDQGGMGMPMPGFNNGPPSFGNGPPNNGPPSFPGMHQTPSMNNGGFMPMPSSDLGYSQPSPMGVNAPYASSPNFAQDTSYPSSHFPLSSSVGSPLPSDQGYNSYNRQNQNPQQQWGNNGQGHQQPFMNSQQPPQNFPPPQPHNPNMFNQPPPHQSLPSNQPVPSGVGNYVEVSNFSGRKKALLIGINYFGTKAALRGCINDVRNVQSFINRCYGFRNEDMVILTDDQKNDPSRMPTRSNMIQAMRWLVEGARPNDSFFFHFSGHGSQQKDADGDESDGYDETICPLDYDKAGMIVDDELNSIMVRSLPQGCRLTAIFDCCHSGTALDLPYIYDEFGKLKSYSPSKAVKNTFMDLGKKYMMGDTVGALMSLKNGISSLTSGGNKNKKNETTKSSLADVIMFSGCMDDQTSADAYEKGVGATGAMSFALIKCLSSAPHNTPYIQLLNSTRGILKEKYTQIPMLSSGRPMDMNTNFNM